MQLSQSLLKNVYFKSSKVDLANFRFARLENVIFEDCIVNGLDFYSAKLKNVDFRNCRIIDVEFSDSHLINVDLSRSELESIKGLKSMKGVCITYSQLMQLAPAMAVELGLKLVD